MNQRIVRSASLVFIMAFSIFLEPCLFAAPKSGDTLTESASAEYMYGVPSDIDLDKIIDKPLLLDWTNFVFNEPVSGEKRLGGYADVVAVYDIPMPDLLEVSLDFESYPSFVPRIFGTSILSHEGQTYRLKYNAGIKFLGLDITFDSIFESQVEHLPDEGVGIRSWLVESLDDASYEHFTSFYFCPVTLNGRTMTFVRYFNRPGVKRPSLGMLQVLNVFTPSEARGQVSAIARETRRRIGRR